MDAGQQAADRAGKIAEARRLSAMLAALNALPKPLIARVQGNVYGGGVGLLAVSDIAIGAEGIRLALTETRLGLIPATIGPFVVRRMGEGMARQVFFSGNAFGTDFALRAGLLHEVCPAGAPRRAGAPADRGGAEDRARRRRRCQGALPRARQRRGRPTSEVSIAALADRWESDEAQERIRAFLG